MRTVPVLLIALSFCIPGSVPAALADSNAADEAGLREEGTEPRRGEIPPEETVESWETAVPLDTTAVALPDTAAVSAPPAKSPPTTGWPSAAPTVQTVMLYPLPPPVVWWYPPPWYLPPPVVMPYPAAFVPAPRPFFVPSPFWGPVVFFPAAYHPPCIVRQPFIYRW